MPNRMLRDGINDSRAVNSLSLAGEVFYRRLMSYVDDFGRCECDLDIIRARLFGRQFEQWPPERIQSCIEECSELIVSYEVGHKSYLEIQNFRQRLKENQKSKFPDNPGTVGVVQANPASRARSASPSSTTSHSTSEEESAERNQIWLAANFSGPEDFESWFQGLLFKHPNRNRNGAARGRLMELILQGQFNRTEFERWYEEQIPIWQTWKTQWPNLQQVFDDAAWRFPNAPVDDGLSPTMRAVLAMED